MFTKTTGKNRACNCKNPSCEYKGKKNTKDNSKKKDTRKVQRKTIYFDNNDGPVFNAYIISSLYLKGLSWHYKLFKAQNTIQMAFIWLCREIR